MEESDIDNPSEESGEETPVKKGLVIEEMSPNEKKSMIEELLKEGDKLAEQKEYNQANATYETIFLIQPGNIDASKRIDRLKKKMMKEGVFGKV